MIRTNRTGRIDFDSLDGPALELVANGCGAKGFPVPDWGHFLKACGEHDLRYWEGNTEADRVIADREFHINMHRAARRARWWLKWPLYAAAHLYFRVVKRTGVLVYNYGPRRTQADLEALTAEFTDGKK